MEGSQQGLFPVLQFNTIGSISADGSLNLDQENIGNILDTVNINGTFPADDTPVNIIVIKGPNNKDKALLTSLLVESLANCGDNEYRCAVNKSNITPNGTLGAITLTPLPSPVEESSSLAREHRNISVYPQLFRVNQSEENSKGIVVGIMEIPNIQGADDALYSCELEEFLALVCSKILALEWTGKDKIQLTVLQPYLDSFTNEDNMLLEPIRLEEVCNAHTHTVRCTSHNMVNHLHLTSSDGQQPIPTTTRIPKPLTQLIEDIIRSLERKTVPLQYIDHTLTLGNLLQLSAEAANGSRKQRQEREKARADMETLVKDTTSKIEALLPAALKYWINWNLSVTTVSEVESIEALVVNKISEQYKKLVHPALQKEFETLLQSYYDTSCQPVVANFQTFVVTLNGMLQETFATDHYICPDKLKRMVDDFYCRWNVMGDFIEEFKTLAGDKLLALYSEHNGKILDTATNRFIEGTANLDQVFRREMTAYLNQNKYDYQTLEAVHTSLLTKMQEAIKSSFAEHATNQEFNGGPNQGKRDRPLENSLVSEETLGSTQESIIQILQIEKDPTRKDSFTKCTDKLLNVYNDAMKAYFMGPPYDTGAFQNLHFSLSRPLVRVYVDALKSVPFGLGTMLSQQKYFEGALQQEFEILKQVNEGNLEKQAGETTRLIEKYKKQYDEMVKETLLKYPDGVDEKKLSKLHAAISTEVTKLLEMEIRSKVRSLKQREEQKQILQSYVNSCWKLITEFNRDTTKLKMQGAETEFEEENSLSFNANHLLPLPPLSFHLQSSQITMGTTMNSHRIIENEFGEEQTPAVVIVRPDNGIVYGSQALESAKNVLNFCWRLADMYETTDSSEKNSVFCEQNRSITAEFMLAFILRKLKQAAEDKLKGRCDTAVFAIPFGLTSTQRIRIKDAGKIGGFSKVYLVNEAAAATYNLVNSDSFQGQRKILVVTENLDNVHAFVYFSRSKESVEMAAHLHSTQTNPTEADVRRTCRNTLDTTCMRFGGGADIFGTLVIAGNSNKWNDVLIEVARKLGTLICGFGGDMGVINGTMMLSENPAEIGSVVRDMPAFDVCWGDKRVMSKDFLLPMKSITRIFAMLPGQGETKIYQEFFNAQHLIGELRVDGVNDNEFLEPCLNFGNEGIVSLNHVVRALSTSEKKCRVADDVVRWTTPNLVNSQIQEQISVMKIVLQSALPNEHSPLFHAKMELLQKCEEVSGKLKNDQFGIAHDLTKFMTLQIIANARKIGHHTNASMEDIQRQIKYLVKFGRKYEK